MCAQSDFIRPCCHILTQKKKYTKMIVKQVSKPSFFSNVLLGEYTKQTTTLLQHAQFAGVVDGRKINHHFMECVFYVTSGWHGHYCVCVWLYMQHIAILFAYVSRVYKMYMTKTFISFTHSFAHSHSNHLKHMHCVCCVLWISHKISTCQCANDGDSGEYGSLEVFVSYFIFIFLVSFRALRYLYH